MAPGVASTAALAASARDGEELGAGSMRALGERRDRANERSLVQGALRGPGDGHPPGKPPLADLNAQELGALVRDVHEKDVARIDFPPEPRGVRQASLAQLARTLVPEQKARFARDRAIEVRIDLDVHGLIAQLHDVYARGTLRTLDLHAIFARGGALELERSGTEVSAIQIQGAAAFGHAADHQTADPHSVEQIVGLGEHADHVRRMRRLARREVRNQSAAARGLFERALTPAGLKRAPHESQASIEDLTRRLGLAVQRLERAVCTR